MNLRTDIKALLRSNVRLSLYTTMQAGGPAKYFAEPATEDELLDLIEFARQENLPWMILGKGSNTIFSEDGYPGLVITLIRFEQDRILFEPKKNYVTASAGIYLYRLVLACRDKQLGGSEFLANIPGTLGGALVMNAGFSRFAGQTNQISDIVEEVTILNAEGKKETVAKKDLDFSYRHSNLDGKIVLSGTLHLWYRPSEEIQKEIKANFDYRNEKQDLKHPSSGSIFKNPGGGMSAGQLIEKAGMKGARVGGAMVSLKHGNYFINAGNAKGSEFLELIAKVQKTVFDATGIKLEPEVRIIQKP